MPSSRSYARREFPTGATATPYGPYLYDAVYLVAYGIKNFKVRRGRFAISAFAGRSCL